MKRRNGKDTEEKEPRMGQGEIHSEKQKRME